MANNDRIYAAYMGEMGETFKQQTRDRIDWILRQVQGRKTILDIGCSQGIVAILCAQQGSTVTGVEIQKENYDFANSLLSTEYDALADSVRFINQDFMEYDEEVKYDAVILTEVLEHLSNAEEFLAHAARFLKEDGIAVITVPFGYCDHPDHVYTFYLTSLKELVEKVFQIRNVYYGGRWLACVADKGQRELELDKDLFIQEETAFLQLHKDMDTRLRNLMADLAEASQKYRESCESYERVKEWYGNEQQKNAVLTENYDRVKEWHESSLEKIQIKDERIQEQQDRLLEQSDKIQKQSSEIQRLQNRVEEQQNRTEEQQSRIEEQQSRIKEQQNKIQDQAEAYERIKQWRENDQQKLIDVIKAEHQQMVIMQKAKRTIQKQQTEIQLLRAENESYKQKLSVIYNTWYGKIAMKCYNLLKKIKRKLVK